MIKSFYLVIDFDLCDLFSLPENDVKWSYLSYKGIPKKTNYLESRSGFYLFYHLNIKIDFNL